MHLKLSFMSLEKDGKSVMSPHVCCSTGRMVTKAEQEGLDWLCFPFCFSHFSGLILGSLIWIPALLSTERPSAFTLSLQWNSNFIPTSLTCKVGIIFTHWTGLKTAIYLFVPAFHNWHSQIVLPKVRVEQGFLLLGAGLVWNSHRPKRLLQNQTKKDFQDENNSISLWDLKTVPVSHRK